MNAEALIVKTGVASTELSFVFDEDAMNSSDMDLRVSLKSPSLRGLFFKMISCWRSIFKFWHVSQQQDTACTLVGGFNFFETLGNYYHIQIIA